MRQFYSVTEVRGPRRADCEDRAGVRSRVAAGERRVPLDAQLRGAWRLHVIESANNTRVFAGQRDDPFFVDLGGVFDLLGTAGRWQPEQPGRLA